MPNQGIPTPRDDTVVSGHPGLIGSARARMFGAMRGLASGLLVVVLAGCPPRKGGGGGPVVAPAGVGCPAASGVWVASYLAPEDGGKGRTGWVLPLSDKGVASLKDVPSYAALDAAAAQAAGVPAPPPSIWLIAPNGPPCKAAIGGYYAAAIDSPSPNIAYGVELSGCAAPQDPSDATAIAIASAEPPGKCRPLAPRPVAARLGETTKDGIWQRPTKETPIPPAFAAVVPQKPCAAPSCEKLWSIAQVELDGKPLAWAGAVNWLAIPPNDPPSKQCEWRAEAFSGFFVAGPDGAPVKVTEGQDHPLVLTAVLADDGGPKVLLATGPGEYTAYDLSGGHATVGHHLVWLVPHPEAYGALDHLGPDCGP